MAPQYTFEEQPIEERVRGEKLLIGVIERSLAAKGSEQAETSEDPVLATINSSTPDALLDTIAGIHDLLAHKTPRKWNDPSLEIERNDYHAIGRQQINDTPMEVEYEAPRDAGELLENLIEQMIGNVTESNRNIWAAKLYALILFSHYFGDQNGRTSRAIFALVDVGQSISLDMLARRNFGADIFDDLRKNALKRLLLKYANTDNVSMTFNASPIDNEYLMSYEKEDSIKFIAAVKAGIVESRLGEIFEDGKLPEGWQIVKIIGGKIVMVNEKGEDVVRECRSWSQREIRDYEEALNEVRKERCLAVLEVIDNDSFAVDLIEASILCVPINSERINVFGYDDLIEILTAIRENDNLTDDAKKTLREIVNSKMHIAKHLTNGYKIDIEQEMLHLVNTIGAKKYGKTWHELSNLD